MKRFLPLFLATTLSAFANNWHGFFIGAQGGLYYLMGKQHVTGSTQVHGMNDIGLSLGANSGYLAPVEGTKMFWGVEAFGALNTGTYNRTFDKTNVALSPKQSLGFSGIFGACMNPKVGFYGRLGYEWNRFEFRYTGPVQASEIHSSKGFVPGVGMLYRIAPNLFSKFELSYIGWTSRLTTSKGNYKPKEVRFLVGVSYLFN